MIQLLIILSIIVVIVSLYFAMNRIDKFTEENQQEIRREMCRQENEGQENVVSMEQEPGSHNMPA